MLRSLSEAKKWVNSKTKEILNLAVHNQIRETTRGQKVNKFESATIRQSRYP